MYACTYICIYVFMCVCVRVWACVGCVCSGVREKKRECVNLLTHTHNCGAYYLIFYSFMFSFFLSFMKVRNIKFHVSMVDDHTPVR